MNPLEKIESDKRLRAILDGLLGMWHFNEEFLSLVLYHTDDYDLSNDVIEIFSGSEIGLEEALFTVLGKDKFREVCYDSEFLNEKECEKLMNDE